MSNVEEETTGWSGGDSAARLVPPPPPRTSRALAWTVRALARLWIVSMLLMAAAVAGIAVFVLGQTQEQLRIVREEPGAASYSVVAYRRELARQVEEMRRDEVDNVSAETLPTPPDRPRQLVEIDSLRERNAEERRLANIAAANRSARPRITDPRIPE
jgi:hypothetical protein